ncbi:hypothetical protein [Methylobacterium oryzisoli]|uniref:hypothetical protein n=1 Tax=Methylobacterium oryzisoli TaxID=3385502 RepID=UPI003891A40B
MKTATQAEFAKMHGVSQARVSQWKSKGLLSMTPEGRVKVEESEWLLADRPASYRGGKTKGPNGGADRREKPAVARPDETPEQAAERIVVDEGVAPFDHAEAVRVKENYLALLRRLEFDLKSGAVVPIDTVIAGIVEQYARVRNKLLNLPTRVAPRAAVLKSAEEVRALVEAEVLLVLQELTLDGEGHVSLSELRDVLRERFGTVH